MRYTDNPERQRVVTQALAATTLPEIEGATRALRQWVREHPDDIGLTAAFEQLSLMQDIAEEQEAQRCSESVAQPSR